jgi:hypothetical protein
LPPGYIARPALLAGLQFLWNAFWELTTDRALGFGGEGRIPSMAIRSFAKEHGITGNDFPWFLAVIREMDAEYLGMRTPTQPQVLDEVPITDFAGMKGLLRRLAKKPVTPVQVAPSAS